MIAHLPFNIKFGFATLRGRLLAAFVGVLVLSLVLTGATFWGEIRIYDTQQVQSDLAAAAPSVFTQVKSALVRYSHGPRSTRESLRAELASIARRAGVRVILTDYCNHVPIDTSSLDHLVSRTVPANCSQSLDDTGATRSPQVINVEPSCAQVRPTNSLPGGGTTFYVACSASFSAALEGTSSVLTDPLLVRTIIIAKSSAGVDQQALSSIVPKLVAAGVLAVAVTFLVVLLIVRAVTRPLRFITMASERMAGGDYDQRVPESREDEVGQLARSFNRMASEVSTAREMQRQLIANVSHDLKTPLTSIVGFSQILADSDEVTSDPTQRRAVQVIGEEARRLQRLTQDLLDLSRLEAGQLKLRREAVDLNALAGDALARYMHLPSNAAIDWRDQRGQGSLVVSGDADRLMQVLVNLLDNAVKFCEPGGSVAVSTARLDHMATITIANTGVGIASEDLSRVFQRFYRADHSRAATTGGTGLGLAIVREIVDAHSGGVRAHSDGDGWIRFVVSLPLQVRRKGPASALVDPRMDEAPHAPAGTGRK